MLHFRNRKALFSVLGFLLLALISYFILSDAAFFHSMNAGTIAYLDEKREEVMTLTVLSGVISTAITAIPGDIGIPVAENFADIADYLLVVFGGIWVQKYLVSLAMALTFKFFIPISCLISAANTFLKLDHLKAIATRFTLFSLLILFLVPSSVWLSKHIEGTYQYSVQEKIVEIESTASEVEEDKNFFEELIDNVTDYFAAIKEKTETALANMLEAAVVLIITSCIIPILVFLIFFKAFHFIFGITLPTPPYKPTVFNKLMKSRQTKKVVNTD
ncbi:TPA: hypothetical protein ACGOY6_000930 [Streptococcus suis]